ncbi:MAG TPA: MOSC domain-containing protein [Candidatus Tenderia electrophaga]|uniref:MOSC domain-containing protein n=1 Tax=Candidatus Tenderia electrophaga TaxID=1748243 RepID=A0A832J4E5_9GAMM|nr:MOSC domain-containing protein [Candidatus Tenderia electrophaga]
MAQLSGIATRAKKRADMQLLQSAAVTLEKGIADDFRGKPGKRQVTVMTQEGWQTACAEAGVDLSWLERRANLLVEGLNLQESVGAIIRIGTVKLLITRETDPCQRMEEAQPGLFAAMAKQWRGGVCCQVLEAGQIAVGDEVELLGGQ